MWQQQVTVFEKGRTTNVIWISFDWDWLLATNKDNQFGCLLSQSLEKRMKWNQRSFRIEASTNFHNKKKRQNCILANFWNRETSFIDADIEGPSFIATTTVASRFQRVPPPPPWDRDAAAVRPSEALSIPTNDLPNLRIWSCTRLSTLRFKGFPTCETRP